MKNNGNPIPMNLRPATLTKNDRIKVMKRETSKLYDPDMRKLRRQQIVMSKVMGLNNQTIGKLFKLSNYTVADELRKAKKEGILDLLNERILEELVPDAIAVYKQKLIDEKDPFVAKDVLKHLDRLTARKDEKERQTEIQYSMDAYIKAKRELPNGQVVSIEQRVKGEAAKQLLEQGNLEPAPKEGMGFLDAIEVEVLPSKPEVLSDKN